MFYIDTRCDIRYASFYIQGLYEVFGKSQVKFSNKHTSEISLNEYKDIVDKVLLIVETDNSGKVIKKVVIDFRDPDNILKDAYEWCDRYAKCNYQFNKVGQIERSKIYLIPPSFGIKIWSNPTILFYAIYNLILSYKTHNFTSHYMLKRQFLTYVWMILRRKSLSVYLSDKYKKEDSKYVYLIGSLWNYKECIEHTNKLRHTFMECCLNDKNIKFEGGFIVHSFSAEIPESWKPLCINKRVSIMEYIRKTQQSSLVFNTPAVRQCHGWKLGEFLAMGKTIISTPLINDLTYPLEHKKNIYIVNNQEETIEAINYLSKNPKISRDIGREARKYFDSYANPSAVISDIFRDELYLKDR